MVKITSEIANGNGKLILSEAFLCDSAEQIYVDIPTTSGDPFRISFKIIKGYGDILPKVEFTKNLYNMIEITSTFYDRNLSFVSATRQIPIIISGGFYQFLFCVSRLVGNAYRVEFTLYEVPNV